MNRMKSILFQSVAVLLLATTIHLDNNVQAQNIYGAPTDLVQMESPQAIFQPMPTYDTYNAFNNEQEMGKRRRRPGGRKRKRRPQPHQYQQVNESEDWQAIDPTWYTAEPGIGQTQQRWDQVYVRDEPTTPAPPRRTYSKQQRQPYADGREKLQPSTSTQPTRDRSYRKPYSQAKRTTEETPAMDESNASILKNILKQSGGLSLSEILQQKNLSLADLLKGKHNPLTVLTENTIPPLTIVPKTTTTTVPPRTTTEETAPVTEPVDEDNELPRAEKIIRAPTAETPTPAKTFERNSARRIPSFSRPKVTETPSRRLPQPSSSPDYIGFDAFNSVEEPAEPTTYPTISAREERQRPIKEIVSRMRPDLTNSNIRTRFSNQILRRKPAFMKVTTTEEAVHQEEETTQVSHTWMPERRRQKTTTTTTEATVEEAEEAATTEFVSPTTPSVTTPTTTTTTTTTTSAPTTSMNSIRNRFSAPRQRIRPTTKATTEQPKSEPLDDVEISEGSNVVEDSLQLDFTKPTHLESIEQLFSTTTTTTTQRTAEEQLISRINENTERSYTRHIFEDMDVTESNPSLFVDLDRPSTFDDKSDIMELLNDRRSGSRLTKILAQRNMTLEELFDQRERGSSQLHLAEIINARSRAMAAPKSEDRWDIVTAFEHFPRFNIGNLKSVKPDEIKTDSRGFSYFASIINIKPTDDGFKESSVPKESQAMISQMANNEYPTWRSVAYGGHPSPIDQRSTHVSAVSSRAHPPNSAEIEYNSPDEDAGTLRTIQQIENEVSRANDILDLELSGHSFTRNAVRIESSSYISIGMRSAIIASLCIVGVSLFIFIIIFVTCKWRQRQQNKLDYMDSFRIAKNRMPSLQRETIKKCVSPELFATTASSMSTQKLNAMDPNSSEVQDYLWTTDRRQSYH